jgi:hypothetical protein
MLVTGRFGLKSYSLADPADPQLLDELDAEALRLQGDPPVDFTEVRGTPTNAGTPRSTFWQNKDMDVDKRRKLALLSRDPRAFAGSTIRDPGDPDPNGATNIAGVYVVSASDGGARGYWTSGRHFYPFDRVTRRATPIDPIPYSGGGLPQSVTSDTTGGFEHNAARPVGGPYHPAANFCSAHYFDVDGSTVTYAWYGEGTRFLDVSDPANPTQFAYWRPDDGVV